MANDIDDNVTEAGDLISVESFGEIATAINELIDSCPIGSICPIATGMSGVPIPDPTIWQLCDGGPITEPNSPLRGQNTPDLRDRYLKGAGSAGESGTMGGSNTRNLAHGHGNVTGMAGPNGTIVDDGIIFWEAIAHSHSISIDLDEDFNFEPLNFRLKHYLKIR